MNRYVPWLLGTGLVLLTAGVLPAQEKKVTTQPPTDASAQAEFDALHEAYVAKYKPLYIKRELAWWDASITGSDEAYEQRRRADVDLIDLHGDRKVFARLKAMREGGGIQDPVRRRLLEIMYLTFLPSQSDPEISKRIVALEGEVEQIFGTHRSMIDGKPNTENDIREILGDSTDSAAAEKAWKAYMAVGQKVDAKLRELVRLRNQAARQLGFSDFYAMKLALQEIDPADLSRLFDELDALTREPFARLKAGIDAERAARFAVKVEALRPWHFGDLFFQEAPTVQRELDLDDLYKDKDPVVLAKSWFAGLGMPVDDILARSDLYEKSGKSPHAYCTDMDRAGDVRVYCNLKPTLGSMDTLLHELGHAVYSKYLDPDLPFVLRDAANAVTTEGIALLTGSMSKNQEFLVAVAKVDPQQAAPMVQAAHRALEQEKLIFCRWTQVMVRFEQGMYSNPDQDLSKLWWDLKKRYQLLNPPEPGRPDYAAKHHVVAAPAYYHSYMMGDLFACQVQEYLAKNLLRLDDPHASAFVGRKDVAAWLREKVFAPGSLYSWNDLTRRATGEPLTAKYFAELYVNPP